ncbi:hypothetical protein EVAR_19603_1 [Eumeta japonica]|uniref:Uncharacterized protein n=1 Tax=Eumeta variegata TaxID=151549 RepID=A0A4C1UGL2_EUMVA|nr:hypothetical protein EVAR_19603_1 [Eumeta japonica]
MVQVTRAGGAGGAPPHSHDKLNGHRCERAQLGNINYILFPIQFKTSINCRLNREPRDSRRQRRPRRPLSPVAIAFASTLKTHSKVRSFYEESLDGGGPPQSRDSRDLPLP